MNQNNQPKSGLIISKYFISVVKNLNASNGGHFFDKDTLRFFNSKYDKTAILPQNGNSEAYFITSEQNNDNPRKYTLRMCNMKNGKIDTVGEFQAYNTHKEAVQILTDYKRYLWNGGNLTLAAYLQKAEAA